MTRMIEVENPNIKNQSFIVWFEDEYTISFAQVREVTSDGKEKYVREVCLNYLAEYYEPLLVEATEIYKVIQTEWEEKNRDLTEEDRLEAKADSQRELLAEGF